MLVLVGDCLAVRLSVRWAYTTGSLCVAFMCRFEKDQEGKKIKVQDVKIEEDNKASVGSAPVDCLTEHCELA